MSRCWSGACHAAQTTAVLQALVDARPWRRAVDPAALPLRQLWRQADGQDGDVEGQRQGAAVVMRGDHMYVRRGDFGDSSDTA
jgi:hypothetical protein